MDAIERLRNEYNDEIPGMLISGYTAADRLRASIAHLIDAGDKAVA